MSANASINSRCRNAAFWLLTAISVPLADCYFASASISPSNNEFGNYRRRGGNLLEKNKMLNPLVKRRRSITSMSDGVAEGSGVGDLNGTRGGTSFQGSLFSGIRENALKLYNGYMKLLDQKPCFTKSVTAAVVSVLGDVMSQWVEAKVAGTSLVLNWTRLGGFFLCGGLFVGPFVHVWYEQLWKLGRWMERQYGASKTMQTLAQLVMDQTVGVAIFFPSYFYVYECLEAAVTLRAPALSVAHAKCKEQIASVLIMQYYIWPFTNWVNFAYVPENLRVLFSNIIAVFWNAYLCTRVA